MDKISKLKLGLDSNTIELIVTTDIIMKSKHDYDDLYLIMFNIMDEPLRLSVIGVSNLLDMAAHNSKMNEAQLISLLKANPEKYITLATQDINLLGERGKEFISINLDSEKNATKSRLVVSSMIDKQYYIQKSNYHVEGEIIEKDQKIETVALIPQLKLMLEIIKSWDTFNTQDFQKKIENGEIKL
tara:strand:+ start:657 stop:1214 length:558 start_codon:yes stop_codon:yes gene_type:complete